MKTRLQSWYDELTTLPPNAEEWGEAGEFLTLLKELTESMRDSAARQSLAHELESLRTLCDRELRFFGFKERIGEWSIATCPNEQIQTLTSQITQIRTGLLTANLFGTTHNSLHEMEDAARRARLLHDKIEPEISLCGRLLKPIAQVRNESVQNRDGSTAQIPAHKDGSEHSRGDADPPPAQPDQPLNRITEDEPQTLAFEDDVTRYPEGAPPPSQPDEPLNRIAEDEPLTSPRLEEGALSANLSLAQSEEQLTAALGPVEQTDSMACPEMKVHHEESNGHSEAREPEDSKTESKPSPVDDDPNEASTADDADVSWDEVLDQYGPDYTPEPLQEPVMTPYGPAIAVRRAPEKYSEFADLFTSEDNATRTHKGPLSSYAATEALHSLSAVPEVRHQGAVWSLLAQADLTGAYWLARGLEEAAVEPAVPSWLIGLLQGSIWSSTDDTDLLDSLCVFLRDEKLNEMQSALAFAAALPLALVGPGLANAAGSPVKGWLVAPDCLSQLSPLAEMIDEFAQLNYPVQPADVTAIVSDNDRDMRVHAARKHAEEFLVDRRQRKRPTRMPRANDVYAALVREGGELSTFLRPVVEGRSDAVAEVRRKAAFWSDQRHVRKLIDDIDGRLIKLKAKPIVSDPFEALLGLCNGAIHLGLRWCNVVEGRKKEDAWIQEPLIKLRNGVGVGWPLFRAACSGPTADLPRRAVQRCLLLALLRVGEVLSIDFNEPQPRLLASPDWFVSGADGIEPALSRRLLWFPETGGASHPMAEETYIAASLLLSPDAERSVPDALRRWLQDQDFRFIDHLITLVDDAAARESLRLECEERHITAERELQNRKNEITAKIRQAVIDGVLHDREGRDSDEQLSMIVPEECVRFTAAYVEIDEIGARCETALTEKGRAIVERWRTSRKKAYEGGVRLQTIVRLDELMHGLLSRKSLRAAEQLIDSADVAAVRGESDIEAQFSLLAEIGESSGRDVLAEFLDIEQVVYQWLVDFRHLSITDDHDKNYLPAKIQRGRGALAGRLGPIADDSGRREAAKGVETFLRLLRLGSQHHERRTEMTTTVQDLLRFLGFVQVGGERPPVVVEKSDPDWAVVAANNWSDGGTSPVPEYGSVCKGNYRIICLWNNFQLQRLEPLLESLGTANRPTLLIYLAATNPDMRRRIRDITVRRKSSLLLLDATLQVFLAHEKEARLRSFFLVALPFSYAMPYIRERGGAVPREIFFGREDMIDRLWNPNGTCIIYGGRQLGKSALQNHIEQRFNIPAREQYVFVIDMSAVYAPQKGNNIDNIWNELRGLFADSNLFKDRTFTSARPDTVSGHIRNAVNEVPDRRVLVLLDESNDFLEAGQSEQFNTINKLCDLMEATEWRFKVVFAGNRDVQRFSNIPNQRITRNGEPVVVGPLETPAAAELIRRPSEALGFRFADQSAILRILSYTSGHANLIQFFLHELLTDRYAQVQAVDAPRYLITGKQVDALYRRQNVRNVMQDRIDMTLALDDDYRLICFAAALDQWPGDENLTRCYATAELLALARERWPAGFDHVTFSLMRVKLDEMCGLGLLVRDREGRYRLISPSLMRLFGSVSDIEAQLGEIARKPRPMAINEESLHAWVGGSKATRTTRYCPLTFAQESLLSRDRIGVRLLFASVAMGSAEIVDSFPRLLPDIKTIYTACDDAGDIVSNYKTWVEYLEVKWQEGSRQPATSNVIYQRAYGTPAQLRESVTAALDFCSRSHVQRNEKRSLRVLFIFRPEAAWNWMSNSESDRAALESRCQQILYPRKWDIVAIQRRLEETGHVVTPDICRSVLEGTGGWPSLLDRVLLHHSKRYEDLEDACALLREELDTPGNPFRETFRRTLGIENCVPLSSLWTFLATQSEPAFKILLEEELIDGLPIERLDSALTLLKYFGLVEEKLDARDGQVFTPDPVAISVWG